MFSKRRRHDVLLVLLFWLGALEFKILKFLFFRCLNIFLGNFPRFSVHKSLKTKANSQRARTPVFLVYFLQKAKANNQSVNTENSLNSDAISFLCKFTSGSRRSLSRPRILRSLLMMRELVIQNNPIKALSKTSHS